MRKRENASNIMALVTFSGWRSRDGDRYVLFNFAFVMSLLRFESGLWRTSLMLCGVVDFGLERPFFNYGGEFWSLKLIVKLAIIIFDPTEFSLEWLSAKQAENHPHHVGPRPSYQL